MNHRTGLTLLLKEPEITHYTLNILKDNLVSNKLLFHLELSTYVETFPVSDALKYE